MRLNTHNKGKQSEYSRFFAKYGINISFTNIDLKEIKSQDKHLVLAYKLLEVPEMVIVDDTSLDIDGFTVGTDIRWIEDNLFNTDIYVGKDCQITVMLGYRSEGKINIYSGITDGKICRPIGKMGFGFDPCVIPDGECLSLAQNKPDHVNPRMKSVNNLINNIDLVRMDEPPVWNGEYQG